MLNLAIDNQNLSQVRMTKEINFMEVAFAGCYRCEVGNRNSETLHEVGDASAALPHTRLPD